MDVIQIGVRLLARAFHVGKSVGLEILNQVVQILSGIREEWQERGADNLLAVLHDRAAQNRDELVEMNSRVNSRPEMGLSTYLTSTARMRTCKHRTAMLMSLPKQASFLRISRASLQNRLQVISFSLAEATPEAPGFMVLVFRMK